MDNNKELNRDFEDYGIDRYRFIKNVNLETRKFHKKLSPYDMCICYIVWDNFAYCKYAYISMLSAFKTTDIENYSKYIILSPSIYNNYNVDKVYSDLGFIVIKPYKKLYKYNIYDTLDYKYICTIDSDIFFYGRTTNLFSRIYNCMELFSEKKPFLTLGREKMFSTKERLEMVNRRVGDKFPLQVGVDEHTYNSWKINKEWIANAISVYDTRMFNKEWIEWKTLCEQKEIWDDEYVLLMWLWKNDIPISYFNIFTGLEVKLFNDDNYNFFEKDWINGRQTTIVHPLYYHTKVHDDMRKFIDYVYE